MTATRYLLDEHVERAVAVALRGRRIEATTVHELGEMGRSDEAHMRWAATEGWVIVTGDRDFLRLASAGVPHAGIAFFVRRTASIGLLIRRLLELHQSETLESMRGRVHYL